MGTTSMRAKIKARIGSGSGGPDALHDSPVRDRPYLVARLAEVALVVEMTNIAYEDRRSSAPIKFEAEATKATISKGYNSATLYLGGSGPYVEWSLDSGIDKRKWTPRFTDFSDLRDEAILVLDEMIEHLLDR